MNGKEIGIVEGEQQCVFINVQQVLVGSDEQRNIRQRCAPESFPSFCSDSGMSEESIIAPRTA